MKPKIFLIIFIVALFFNLNAFAENKDNLFQYSTINALLEGNYDSNYSFKNLKRHGNLGIGTFNALDGEMIELDSIVYQIKSTGKVITVPNNATTPFAMVVFFKSDKTVHTYKNFNILQLNEYLDSLLPTKNVFYSFKISGTFKKLVARSVSKQINPYPDFSEAIKNQTIFNFENLSGTLIGFRMPEYMHAISVPGYHWHFISKSKTDGGHVLDISSSELTIQIDQLNTFSLELPNSASFYKLLLNSNRSNEIKKYENATLNH